MSDSPLPLISESELHRAGQRALWRGYYAPGGLALTYSVAHAMRLPPRARVLDAGCGSGESSVYLAEHLGWQVTAADGDAFALALARDKAKHPGLTLETVQTDLLDLPFGDATFDGVFSQGTFEMFGEARLQAAREWARVLRPGGVLGLGEATLTRPGPSRRVPTAVTLAQTAAVLEAAGLAVTVAALHPHGQALWAEFHAPHHDRQGQVRRPEMAQAIAQTRQEADLLGLGVVVAVKA